VIEAIAAGHPAAGSKGAPMKLPRTVGLAIAVSLRPPPWRRSLRSAERLRPARPRTCVRQT